MGERRWAPFWLFAIAVTILSIPSASAACNYDGTCNSGEYGDAFCPDCNDLYCGNGICDDTPGYEETCSSCSQDCKVCPGGSCSTSSQCQIGNSCCGSYCTATNTEVSCGANMTQVCTSSGWSACTCIEGTTTACSSPSGYIKTCRGGAWSDCEFNCAGVTCNTPPACKLSPGVCGTSGCTYSTNAPRGDACGSTTHVCDSQGSCSLPRCASPSFCSSTSISGATANSNWCDTGTCYTCDNNLVWNGTHCASNQCTSGSTQCSGSNVQSCQLVNNVYQWVTTSTCSGVCTTSSGTASCCTPTCNYPTTCSESVSNGCGGTCTRSTTGNTCTINSQPGTCSGGSCVCTPTSCTYSSTCATTGTDNCGTTNSAFCNRNTNQNSCTINNQAGTCQSGSCICTPTSSSYPSTCATSGTDNCGNTVTRITVGNACTASTGVSGTCTSGEICLQNCASAGGTCGSVPSGATQLNAYCGSGVCFSCPSGTFNSNGVCVTCTTSDMTRCPLPGDSSCQAQSCTNGACGIVNIKEGLSCGTGGQVCKSGVCTGCTTTCSPVITTSNVSTSQGCMVRIDTVETTTARTCQSATCMAADVTTKIISTRTEPAQNGATCAEGACYNGECLNSTCYAVKSNSFSLDWTPYFNQCLGTVSICNMTFTNSNFLNHACTNKTAGVCKAEGFCIQKCQTEIDPTMKGVMPGCMINAPLFATDNGLACQSGFCYECEQGYVWRDGECRPTDYTLTLRHGTAAAQTPVTIIPELRNKQGTIQTNADHRFTFLLSVPGMKLQESKGSFDVTFLEPGEYYLTGSAQLISGTQIANTPGHITVTCPANNPCCPANSNAYSPDGTACYQGKDAGVCRNKVCETTCNPTGSEICNNRRDDDCNGVADCRDAACSSECGGLSCNQGEILCSGQCTDTQSNNLNCGACNNRCSQTQQCVQGSCTEVQGCDVICNTDGECGRGMICMNPGSCTNSYCQPANAIQTTPEGIQSIMEQYAKTYKITSEIKGNKLLIRITNLAPASLNNFNLTVNIPKDVAPSASSLGADHAFMIIQEDPIIMFPISVVNARQDIVIELPRAVDPAFANSIQVTGSHDPLGSPTVLQNEVTITSTMIKENGKSKLLLGIDPHAKLYGVRVPVQIPKCIAASVKDLKLSGDYEVIQDDPLVVWTFTSLTSKQNIEIEVNGDVTESCKNQLTAFAVADLVDKPVNPWILVVIIPLVGVVIAGFARYHPGAQRHLTRAEFTVIAREQGRSESEIREEWEEYERRF